MGSRAKTFTIGFEEPAYNEAHHARAVADYLGTDHHELYLPISRAKELIHDVPDFYDEPFADSSQLATMLVSKLARTNVTVALSGDAGDELFCGYSRYSIAYRLWQYRWAVRLCAPLRSLLSHNPWSPWYSRNLYSILCAGTPRGLLNMHYLAAKHYLDGIVEKPWSFEPKYADALPGTGPIQERFMLLDMATYLPDDILTKVDRASMSVSLEARNPFLDYRIVEWSLLCPHALKYQRGTLKYILRQLLYRHVPRALVDRPKMGFGVPVYEWLHTDLRAEVGALLEPGFIKRQGIFDPGRVAMLLGLFDRQPRDWFTNGLVWTLYMFQLWHSRYIA